MGRTFESIRQGVYGVAERWKRSSRALRADDQRYGEKVAELAKKHASETFAGCNDPLEAAVFSVLIEVVKRQEEMEERLGEEEQK